MPDTRTTIYDFANTSRIRLRRETDNEERDFEWDGTEPGDRQINATILAWLGQAEGRVVSIAFRDNTYGDGKLAQPNPTRQPIWRRKA